MYRCMCDIMQVGIYVCVVKTHACLYADTLVCVCISVYSLYTYILCIYVGLFKFHEYQITCIRELL